MHKIALSAIAFILTASSAPVSAQSGGLQRISNFASGTAGWRSVQIDKKVPATKFTAKRIQGVPAIQAYARKSMALFTRPVTVNLAKTPVLCWRWRVNDVVRTANIAKKSGDDQAARVYIGLDLPNSKIPLGTRAQLALARTRGSEAIPDGAINYVWDNRFPVGTARNNVYTKQAKIIVAQSGAAQAGTWVNERRDLAADIQKQFKTGRAKVTSIAISSDTDNSGETVTAAFADIHLVSANAKCQYR
ncbi:DUF3047 domain-containing protein [Parasphingorhabdus cellanae]|uniref:DUF3047 domain-containing protein n=1 Tax=Parasphingorhabdus cellanae TaxID=2806553 RepID=A0ABX7T8I6_9SPHN|nr:DUF3047 domain-containing protein [Parasphingorhabdus cellanae]QTD56792.1 DUF3047 domain-containing protein [Parasphingorhabdus cellanae]